MVEVRVKQVELEKISVLWLEFSSIWFFLFPLFGIGFEWKRTGGKKRRRRGKRTKGGELNIAMLIIPSTTLATRDIKNRKMTLILYIKSIVLSSVTDLGGALKSKSILMPLNVCLLALGKFQSFNWLNKRR